MNATKKRIIITWTLFALAFSFTGCEKKQTGAKPKTINLLTSRTLGLAYLEENKLSEAEAEFRKLIALAPAEALGYANLGLVYLRQGKYSAAEQQIKQALARTPNDPDIRLMLATLFEQAGREKEALQELELTIKQAPTHAKALYRLAELCAKSDHAAIMEEYLRKLVEQAPANIVVRLQLIETLLNRGNARQAASHLEQLGKQMPERPEAAAKFYDEALALMRADQAAAAFTSTRFFHNLLKVTPLYQAGILALKGPLIGFPLVAFSQNISVQLQDRSTVLAAMCFTDATSLAGLEVAASRPNVETAKGQEMPTLPAAPLAIGDYDGDGDQDLYVASWNAERKASDHFLFRNDLGKFVETTAAAGINHVTNERAAIFADYDNDGKLDLYIVNAGANILYRNIGDGKFLEVTATAGVADTAVGYAALFADWDHDGDLDLYVTNAATNRFYRNNADGTFAELAEKMGIAGNHLSGSALAGGDFDEDGDLDLFVANENAGNRLYSNLRQGQFQDVAAASGLASERGSSAVTAGDYNNDGFLDLFVTASEGGEHHLYRNKGDGTFAADTRSVELLQALRQLTGGKATFLDFDNDGFLDLLVAGNSLEKSGRNIWLFHNDGAGKYTEASAILPAELFSGGSVAAADYDEDGDLDVFLAGLDGSVRLWRNDGGNANHYLKIKLVGLRAGSSKNNYFGLGAKLEVRAGELYQSGVVADPISHFGLGQHSQADAVRILWSNGVPQNVLQPSGDQVLVEAQILKGSCAFLYAWNGRQYDFVTDMMWRSALGMPLGIMGGSTAYAFSDASQEYLKIPSEALQAKDGVYSLQITEELWETAFFDQVKLVVIDHPDTVDIYVDERFVPPPFPPLHIYCVAGKNLPKAARDEHDNDLLAALREKDDVYVANLAPARYQGVTAMHDLILDLGNLPPASRVVLFLHGWLFPTDASINVAMAQSGKIKMVAPFLQVPDQRGKWQTVAENMGFPMGKNKIVAVDLTGKFLSDDHRVRIRTNMEIYWDHVFFSTGEPEIPLRQTMLQPLSANIHYRGFSRMYRKGPTPLLLNQRIEEPAYGPHWFDYNEVSIAPKWRDLEGNYTRYGEVRALLLEADDMYVIINAGDEVTVEFDATQAPALQPGWKRDFLIYSDGWIKDGDLNTAHGKTVAPLPFHGMSRYPYGKGEAYPTDRDHEDYLEKYNTRKITPAPYREWLMKSKE